MSLSQKFYVSFTETEEVDSYKSHKAQCLFGVRVAFSIMFLNNIQETVCCIINA